MDAEEKKRLKAKAKLMEPLVRIGKNGITESVVLQVKTLVTKRKLVKVKFLRSFVEDHDKKKAAKDLVEKTGAELIDRIGFTVVLYKR
ncbi:YhbY family RNA-binding protein [Nanoarchaeota archaeon]